MNGIGFLSPHPGLETRVHHDWSWKELSGSAGAIFSSDGRYRYALTREWQEHAPRLVFIGLNPSTADERVEDPTIRRILGFAQRLGCGSLVMLNLFALRSTDPKALYDTVDPIGPENDRVIATCVRLPRHGHVIAGWGVHGALMNRDAKVGLDELFAREERKGWTTIGNELGSKLGLPLELGQA